MKYDFKSVIDRHNTNSLKWDLFDDELLMWVADMDFKVAPPILDAIKKRIAHPIFAYSIVPDELFEAYINWWDKRYNFKMQKEDLLFSIGVMPSITSILRTFSDVGDNILIQTPVYHAFFHVIENNNRVVVENKLKYDNYRYSIDFDDLDEKLANVKIFLLCNPHNPIGKIWSKSDLEKIGDLCKKHDVVIVSDEIHCDLTDPGINYNPFELSFNYNKAITCISPTKTFNIAGLQSSMIHTKNKEIYNKLKEELVKDFFISSNAFSSIATIAAYRECEEWLDNLKEVLFKNKRIVNDFIENEIPFLKLVPSNATYLLWIDISMLNSSSKVFCEFLRRNYGLFLSPGIQFGQNGDQFLRLNIACPETLLIKGLEKLKAAINDFQ